MPSGPIGREWVNGSWSDTAWEARSWDNVVSGASTATILVGSIGAGRRIGDQFVVVGPPRPAHRPALIHKYGGSVAVLRMGGLGHGWVWHGAAAAAVASEIRAEGQGQKVFHGASAAAGVLVSTGTAFSVLHPVPQPVPVLVDRSRRARYLAALARQPVSIVPMQGRRVTPREDDDELALLEVA